MKFSEGFKINVDNHVSEHHASKEKIDNTGTFQTSKSSYFMPNFQKNREHKFQCNFWLSQVNLFKNKKMCSNLFALLFSHKQLYLPKLMQ